MFKIWVPWSTMKRLVLFVVVLSVIGGGAGYFFINRPAPAVTAREGTPSLGLSPFVATVENPTAEIPAAPTGMVYVPGGTFSMGTDRAWETLCDLPGSTLDATPIHRVYVDAFWMDEH